MVIMAHYAFIDDTNTVTEVIVGRDEADGDWESYYGTLRGQTCLRTSYNTFAGQHTEGGTPFRGNYAGIGYTYDPNLDAFIPPKPEGDYVLNQETFQWEEQTP